MRSDALALDLMPGVGARPGGLRAWVLVSGAVVAAWLGAFELAVLLEYRPHASLWFPPVAITVAALLVLGWRGVPAVVVASVLGTLLASLDDPDPSPRAIAGYAAIFAAQQLGVWGGLAWLLRRAARGGTEGVGSLPATVTTFLLGGALASLVAACIGSAGLVATGAIDVPTMVEQAIPWAIGDYAGLLALAPLAVGALLYLAERLGVAPAPGLLRMAGMLAPGRSTARYAAKLALLLASTVAVLLLAAALPDQPAVVFGLFVVVVIQLWIVHTHGTLHTLVAIAVFSLLVALSTPLLGLGAHALALQFAMISLAANSYFGLAVPGLYADNARLRHALELDPVTGALSRAGFLAHAGHELPQAARTGRPATLVVADLDNLKDINDALGHAAGDAALRAFVSRCRTRLPPAHALGRLGGDEFALFLPDTTPAAAATLVESLRQALAQPQRGDGCAARLSASFGIAACDGAALEGLLARADAQMYADKRQRRRAVATADRAPQDAVSP
jgi:diguanylate cyclase (GGDEF)-like protein